MFEALQAFGFGVALFPLYVACTLFMPFSYNAYTDTPTYIQIYYRSALTAFLWGMFDAIIFVFLAVAFLADTYFVASYLSVLLHSYIDISI
jgi:hypothetical protein